MKITKIAYQLEETETKVKRIEHLVNVLYDSSQNDFGGHECTGAIKILLDRIKALHGNIRNLKNKAFKVVRKEV